MAFKYSQYQTVKYMDSLSFKGYSVGTIKKVEIDPTFGSVHYITYDNKEVLEEAIIGLVYNDDSVYTGIV